MENIRNNFLINKLSVNKSVGNLVDSNPLDANIEIEVMEYDWEKSLDSYHGTALESQLDLILVADCVYDDGLTIALVSVLERLLSMKNKGANFALNDSAAIPILSEFETTTAASTNTTIPSITSGVLAYPIAYVASTIRNKATFDFFLKQLDLHNIVHEFLDTSDKLSTKLFGYCSDDVVLSVLRHKMATY
jgi:hypothetical protein